MCIVAHCCIKSDRDKILYTNIIHLKLSNFSIFAISDTENLFLKDICTSKNKKNN